MIWISSSNLCTDSLVDNLLLASLIRLSFLSSGNTANLVASKKLQTPRRTKGVQKLSSAIQKRVLKCVDENWQASHRSKVTYILLVVWPTMFVVEILHKKNISSFREKRPTGEVSKSRGEIHGRTNAPN